MAKTAIIRIPDVEEEIVIPADEFSVDPNTGELTVYRFMPDGNGGLDLRLWGSFATYTAIYLEDDGEEEDPREIEARQRLYGELDAEEADDDEGDEEGDEGDFDADEADGEEDPTYGTDGAVADVSVLAETTPYGDGHPNSVPASSSAA